MSMHDWQIARDLAGVLGITLSMVKFRVESPDPTWAAYQWTLAMEVPGEWCYRTKHVMRIKPGLGPDPIERVWPEHPERWAPAGVWLESGDVSSYRNLDRAVQSGEFERIPITEAPWEWPPKITYVYRPVEIERVEPVTLGPAARRSAESRRVRVRTEQEARKTAWRQEISHLQSRMWEAQESFDRMYQHALRRIGGAS